MGEKKKKEKKKEKEKGGLPRERLTASNARKDKYERRRNMNENDLSAAFDAEDAFASRMDYMRRKRRRRRRRRREVEKEEEEEEEKVRRQRASEPRRICFVLDGTQKITRNSRSHLGQGLVK